MVTSPKYLTSEDLKKVDSFYAYHLAGFKPELPAGLFHYTTGTNLVSILFKHRIWATHVACLNDSSEYMFAIREFRTAVLERLTEKPNSASTPILRQILHNLEHDYRAAAPSFVTCFTECADDLSQWRAYSGGEGGFAIEFDSNLLASLAVEDESALFCVRYVAHPTLLKDALDLTESLYIQGEGKARAPSDTEWRDDLLGHLTQHMGVFASLIKHDAFIAEKEWRLLHYLRPHEGGELEFLQRSSMLSRHLPLRIGDRLPIKRIIVGPCRHPNPSSIAVGDLLKKCDYDVSKIAIERSRVPYQIV
jgi:hypothetical protein